MWKLNRVVYKCQQTCILLTRQLSSSASKEMDAMKLLRNIQEPISKSKLGSIGCIKSLKVDKESRINLELDLIVPGYPFEKELIANCKQTLQQNLSWIKDINIQLSPIQYYDDAFNNPDNRFSKIAHVIGVSSCKGGVGKSTIAVNLACSLAQKGLKVGILDSDIYGPSLPFQLPAQDTNVLRSTNDPKFVLPLISKDLPNLKMLSFGHVNPNSGAPGAGGKVAALVRGPIATKILNQLLLATDWGEIDYLIVDMPPGTGDIQITLSQTIRFTGAVVVTTPHKLALVDAAKGLGMFKSVNIPILSVVENMAYFKCDHGKKYFPFGQGGKDRLIAALGSNESEVSATQAKNMMTEVEIKQCPYISLPLTSESAGFVSQSNENEKDNENKSQDLIELTSPLVVSCPKSESAGIYHNLAQNIIEQTFLLQLQTLLTPSIELDSMNNSLKLRYFGMNETMDYVLTAKQLYDRNPNDGKKREIANETSKSSLFSWTSSTPRIVSIDLKGRYGVGILFDDKRSDIYSYEVLKTILLEETNQLI